MILKKNKKYLPNRLLSSKFSLFSSRKQKFRWSNFLKNQEWFITIISASDSNILSEHNINLFINIASFGDTKKSVMQNYFDIIKSEKIGTNLNSLNK